jgi:hypothetical protein
MFLLIRMAAKEQDKILSTQQKDGAGGVEGTLTLPSPIGMGEGFRSPVVEISVTESVVPLTVFRIL